MCVPIFADKCVCVCECVCVCLFVFVYVHVERLILSVTPQVPGSVTGTWGFQIRLGGLTESPRDPPSQCWHCEHVDFYMGSGN